MCKGRTTIDRRTWFHIRKCKQVALEFARPQKKRVQIKELWCLYVSTSDALVTLSVTQDSSAQKKLKSLFFDSWTKEWFPFNLSSSRSQFPRMRRRVYFINYCVGLSTVSNIYKWSIILISSLSYSTTGDSRVAHGLSSTLSMLSLELKGVFCKVFSGSMVQKTI